MRTGSVQGPLWGARAHDYATYQEGTSRPLYQAIFDALGVGPGIRLLDVGCGGGLAAQLAAERGARVAGLDASPALLAIARERVANGVFHEGDLEGLPFPDGAFDVVTGFLAFPFAGDPVAALREARRVLRPGGRLAMVVWGRPEDCQTMAASRPLFQLLPPPPPDAPPPVPMVEPEQLAALLQQAGLQPVGGGEIACAWEYPDLDTARRAFESAAPAIRATAHVGAETVRQVLVAALAPYRTRDSGYRLQNRFRYAIGAA